MSEYQEEVLTNLLDLQAELRGDEPEPNDGHHGEASPDGSPEARSADVQETVAVTEEGVTVAVPSPDSANGVDVNERLAALMARLAQVEYELAGVTKRIERMEPDPEVVSSGKTVADVDDRWRSFIDLQK
ncbi:MAG: hypothetical protein M3138_00645, partial [Actinomycetota bacterium]|nr:hypothetical protein [Actinomycetota bacterium]